MNAKTCFKCGEVKSLASFYKHPMMADGHLGKCKECTKRDVRKNREEKLDYYQEYDRERAMLPHIVSARAAYAASPEGKVAGSRAKKSWCDRNTIKRAAHILTGNAVRD